MEELIGDNALLCRGDGDHLIVAFSTILSANTGEFEFHASLTGRGDHVLLLREEKPVSFHSGFTGLTASIEENVEFLRYLRQYLGARRMTCVGICTGGYAAILHGYLAGADDILTANPRTYVDYDTARKLGCGPRFPRQFDPIYEHYAAAGEPPRYLDLRPVIRAPKADVGPIIVHYSENLWMDTVNADHIAGLPGVETVRHESPSHMALGGILRDRGVLEAHLDTPPGELVAYCRSLPPAPDARTA